MTHPIIQISDLSVRYGSAAVLEHVNAEVYEGDMCLVVGPTGSGKTTLLRAIAAQVPHLTGGTMAGRVAVAGRDTRDHLPRDLADVVGVVAQDPQASFVTDTVEEELAFTMEQLGVPRALMRRRVEDVLDLLGIEPLRGRALHTLSGGEAQRVAIGAVLTAQPRVLVLDEPTSALDPIAAEEVLAALSRLVLDSGLTVVLAEHRLERVVQFADQVIALMPAGSAAGSALGGSGGSAGSGRPDGSGENSGARAISGVPADVFASATIRPPVAELGALAGADPLPLTVREARRSVRALRERLSDVATLPPPDTTGPAGRADAPPPALAADQLTVAYADHIAVNQVSVHVYGGEVLAVMGRNGAGKSSLLWALAGALSPGSGRVRRGADMTFTGPARTASARTSSTRTVALVPQSPEDLLFRLTVDAECRAADEVAHTPGATGALLDVLSPGIDPRANPRDLSEGQRLSLALALQLAPKPGVVLLDEPTRGLDYPAKERLAHALGGLRREGKAVVIASHDVEFLALIADRVALLSGGALAAEGPASAMLTDSAFTAPQVARVLAPLPFLTVADVRRALDRPAASGEGTAP